MPNLLKPDLPFACTEKFYRIHKSIKRIILKSDDQALGLFWGRAGSGKSLLMMKSGYLVSGDKLTLDQIAFNKVEYITAVLTTSKGTVIGDEGITLFHAKEAMHRDGIVMQQLIDQMRQKNDYSPIAMVDILDTNKIILDRLNFACHVWESKELIKDQDGKPLLDDDGEKQYRAIKGNYALYPKLKGHDYLTPLLGYLRLRKAKQSNPLVKLPPPPPSYDRSGGTEYKENGNHGFYPVDEAAYRAKKEAILDKYKKAGQRKSRNTEIDYVTLDKLIRAKVKQTEIAKHLDIALSTVKIRAALIRKVHKKAVTKKAKRR